jgi:hypothetical protein
LRQGLQERAEAGLILRIVCRRWQDHADAPHALGLLGVDKKRPHRRSSSKRDEVAAAAYAAPAKNHANFDF